MALMPMFCGREAMIASVLSEWSSRLIIGDMMWKSNSAVNDECVVATANVPRRSSAIEGGNSTSQLYKYFHQEISSAAN